MLADERHILQRFFGNYREKSEKKTCFSKKKQKKSKITLNLLRKMRILKYKGERTATSESRNPRKLNRVDV